MSGAEGSLWSVPERARGGISVAWASQPSSPTRAEGIALRQAVLVLLGLAGFSISSPSLARAAPSDPAAASPPLTHGIELLYQETDEALVSRPVGVKIQNAPFPKEPALPGQDVLRGLLLWGPRPEQAMPFIWDKGRGRLLLDLNRNRDLTDDPKGTFVGASKDSAQVFTNIHLALPTATGKRSVRLQAEFYSYQGGSMNVYAGLCSYWQARLSLRGQEWQVGFVENMPDGKAPVSPKYLLLRPWAERQRAFHLASGTPDFCSFTKGVFFGGRAFDMDYRYESGGESPKYKVLFKEQSPPLGELKVTGADLHRLILTTKPEMTVLLDHPLGTTKLPVGSYSLDEIWLRKGKVEVSRLNAGRIVVDAEHPANLVAGGPLTNSVEARSQGDSLLLNYRLLGADGGAYQFSRPDYKHPPECAVFQGTNRLATGKFQYG